MHQLTKPASRHPGRRPWCRSQSDSSLDRGVRERRQGRLKLHGGGTGQDWLGIVGRVGQESAQVTVLFLGKMNHWQPRERRSGPPSKALVPRPSEPGPCKKSRTEETSQ